jgi:ribonucleoside-diphosphate reductase alpha chain
MSFGRRFVSGRGCKKEIVPYEGLVSCVEVPTGNIIVRRNGMAVVCGNSNRGGSATVSFNVLDPEIETLLNLKLKRSPETKRIDQLDYSLVWNNEFLKSAATRQDWKLYSKKVCPEAHTAFYNGEATQHLDNETSKLNALDILKQYSNNRLETGRLYWTNIDNVNEHTPWKDNIRLSNLCQEVLLPTKEYNSVFDLAKHTYEDGDGITAQCFLSAIDLARITDDTDYEETAYIVLKSLDNLIETMNYPLPQMGATAKHFRSVGVGLTNLAYHLAKEGRKFNDVNYLHYLAERHYYFLMKASIKLSKERGKFGYYDKTKWADGWTPLETYKKNVDTLVTNDRLRYDWASLQGESLRSGVRFSTLTAHMPCESSSVMGNGTNGLYPIRHKVVYKDSKSGLVQFFAPDVDTLEYENAYDVGPYTLINSYSIFQKFNDQGISADTYEDLSKGNGKVSTTELIKKILYANKMGMKTWYYNNTKTGRGEDKTVLVDDGCSSCKL